MTPEELERLIKLEKEILKEITNMNKFSPQFTGDPVDDLDSVFYAVENYIKKKTENTLLYVSMSFPDKVVVTEKSYSVDIPIEIYHKIPSNHRLIMYNKLNTIAKLHLEIEKDNTSYVCSDLQIEETFISFDEAYEESEINSIVYLKYDNLEFVFYSDELESFYSINFIPPISERSIDKVNIKEVLDVETTDGALRFVITKSG